MKMFGAERKTNRKETDVRNLNKWLMLQPNSISMKMYLNWTERRWRSGKTQRRIRCSLQWFRKVRKMTLERIWHFSFLFVWHRFLIYARDMPLWVTMRWITRTTRPTTSSYSITAQCALNLIAVSINLLDLHLSYSIVTHIMYPYKNNLNFNF